MQNNSKIVPILFLIPKMIIALFWKKWEIISNLLIYRKTSTYKDKQRLFKKVWGPFLTVNLDFSVSNGKSSFLSALFVFKLMLIAIERRKVD